MIQNWEDFATLERGFRKKENGLVPISVSIGSNSTAGAVLYRRLAPHVLVVQPLQLGECAFVLESVARTDSGCGSKSDCSRSAVAMQQMPFASVELRVAVLIGVTGD